MNEMTVDAKKENIPVITAFVEEQLELIDCPMKAQIQISVAIDEVLNNIASYAYGGDTGQVTVRFEIVEEDGKSVHISFIDSGIPYNPLEKEDPDITLSAEEREIGGLGIYMVKKSMDSVEYQYENGHNILTIKKAIS